MAIGQVALYHIQSQTVCLVWDQLPNVIGPNLIQFEKRVVGNMTRL